MSRQVPQGRAVATEQAVSELCVGKVSAVGDSVWGVFWVVEGRRFARMAPRDLGATAASTTSCPDQPDQITPIAPPQAGGHYIYGPKELRPIATCKYTLNKVYIAL